MTESNAAPLSTLDVKRIADYVRIQMDEDEIAAMTRDLNATLTTTLAAIAEYDLEGVVPTFHPINGLSNVVREDVEVPGFTQEEALMNAPKQQDGSFLIPAILGDGGDC